MYSRDVHGTGRGSAFMLGCHRAPASSRAQLGAKNLAHAYQPWRAQSRAATVLPQAKCRACFGYVCRRMRFLPSCFSNPLPLRSYRCSMGLPSGPESMCFPAMPLSWCSGDLGSALSGFRRLAPWRWAPPPPQLSQFPLSALDLLRTHRMLPATYWVAIQSRE